ncbi:MAG: ATP-binding cassette domain-containing protein, partial [Actinomycetota bacterium]|nr:ATP-binding cassette domain-containing protein [Actinomycetota bacterium]
AFVSALVLELVAMMGTALVAATVGVQLVSGELGLTVGLTVLLLAPELFAPLRQLGAQFHATADGLAAAEQIFEILEAPPAAAVARRPRRAPDPRCAALRLEDVSFAYPEREGLVLDSVDLELRPGERVAIVGPSGSGKSTLAALLVRLADPTSGRVSCGDLDLREVDPRDWRRRIAWVPQRPTVFAGSVADNIRLGAPDAGHRRVRAAAQAANALDFIGTLPRGLQTAIGEGGRPLSAGEAQRIALARAFLRDAALIVLDEPTAHLDSSGAEAVAAAVQRLTVGRTGVLIVHNPAHARRADRVVTLERGRVVFGQAASQFVSTAAR